MMEPSPCDARRGAAFSQLFTDQPPPPTQAPPLVNVKLACHRVLTETSLLLLVLLTACLATLLIVRPAFVLKFEQDQKRPWRGCTRISWVSVGLTLLVVAVSPFLLRFLLQRGGGGS